MREKLIRLQSLYIDQFKRLQHLLKEKKRRYLHNRKVEHEALGKFPVPVTAVQVQPGGMGSNWTYFHRSMWYRGQFAF